MDKNFIMRSTVFLIAENTMITVDVQNVGITEIMRITVKKQIVSAGNCIGFDPVNVPGVSGCDDRHNKTDHQCQISVPYHRKENN